MGQVRGVPDGCLRRSGIAKLIAAAVVAVGNIIPVLLDEAGWLAEPTSHYESSNRYFTLFPTVKE
jgi:hypothetical protein